MPRLASPRLVDVSQLLADRFFRWSSQVTSLSTDLLGYCKVEFSKCVGKFTKVCRGSCLGLYALIFDWLFCPANEWLIYKWGIEFRRRSVDCNDNKILLVAKILYRTLDQLWTLNNFFLCSQEYEFISGRVNIYLYIYIYTILYCPPN